MLMKTSLFFIKYCAKYNSACNSNIRAFEFATDTSIQEATNLFYRSGYAIQANAIIRCTLNLDFFADDS